MASRRRNGKDTGDENTGDQCPYCFRREMETVILNWDRLTGLVRCKVCFKKMRIDDYRKLALAMKIRKGGRIDTDE